MSRTLDWRNMPLYESHFYLMVTSSNARVLMLFKTQNLPRSPRVICVYSLFTFSLQAVETLPSSSDKRAGRRGGKKEFWTRVKRGGGASRVKAEPLSMDISCLLPPRRKQPAPNRDSEP